MLGFSIINDKIVNPKNTTNSISNRIDRARHYLNEHPEVQRVIKGPVSVSEVQDVTEETPQTISPVQTVPQTISPVQTVPQTISPVQTVPQTQSYVQYVPIVTKPDYKKIILVGGGIILFAILLKKVIR